jgi:hypothetical protein
MYQQEIKSALFVPNNMYVIEPNTLFIVKLNLNLI